MVGLGLERKGRGFYIAFLPWCPLTFVEVNIRRRIEHFQAKMRDGEVVR